MDSTAGDLNHAAKEIKVEVEKQISHSSSDQALKEQNLRSKEDSGQRPSRTGSSGSSSADIVGLEKFDSQIIKIGDVKEGEEAWAHLLEHEKAIIKRQVDIPAVKVNYATLYRYATRNDIIIVVVSAFMAIAGGTVIPLMTVIFGKLGGIFQGYFQGNVSTAEFDSQLSHYTLYFIYLAIAEFCTIYICTVGFIYTGEHIAGKIREQYLAAILRQNVGFFDKLGAGEITTRITADTNLVQVRLSCMNYLSSA